MITKLKNGYTNASTCKNFCIPILNEEIMKSKNIHHYYKRKHEMQNISLKTTTQ